MMAPCDPTDEIVEKLGLTKFSSVLFTKDKITRKTKTLLLVTINLYYQNELVI